MGELIMELAANAQESLLQVPGRGEGEVVKLKRVIVMESERLLSAGAYSLLQTNGHLEVISVALDKQSFIDEATRFKPDVVIMDERILSQNFLGYMAFVKSCPRMRTIVLSLGTNSVQVCDQHIVHVECLDDFFDQI